MTNYVEQKINKVFGLRADAEQHGKDYSQSRKQIEIVLKDLEEQRESADAAVMAVVESVMLGDSDIVELSKLVQQNELAQKTLDLFTEKSKIVLKQMGIKQSTCLRKATSESNIFALTICDKTKVFDVEGAELALEKLGNIMDPDYYWTLQDKFEKQKALADTA